MSQTDSDDPVPVSSDKASVLTVGLLGLRDERFGVEVMQLAEFAKVGEHEAAVVWMSECPTTYN